MLHLKGICRAWGGGSLISSPWDLERSKSGLVHVINGQKTLVAESVARATLFPELRTHPGV